jgi:hypothetical protein
LFEIAVFNQGFQGSLDDFLIMFVKEIEDVGVLEYHLPNCCLYINTPTYALMEAGLENFGAAFLSRQNGKWLRGKFLADWQSVKVQIDFFQHLPRRIACKSASSR